MTNNSGSAGEQDKTAIKSLRTKIERLITLRKSTYVKTEGLVEICKEYVSNTIRERDVRIEILLKSKERRENEVEQLQQQINSLQSALERVKKEKQFLRDIITEKRHNKEDGDPLGTMVFDHKNEREVYVSFLPDKDIFVDRNRYYSIEQIEQALIDNGYNVEENHLLNYLKAAKEENK
jgi:hypothetical protein